MSEDTNKVVDDTPALPEDSAQEEGQAAPSAEADVENAVADEVAGEDVVSEETDDISDDAEAEVADEADDDAEEEAEEEGESESAGEVAVEGQADNSAKMDWYILKVQSNRERSIADALRRKIAIEGLDEFFGDVVVPVEKVTEFKAGKKKIVERKLYPGYIVVNMHINDDTWFAVRETSGIGDFTGSGGKPTPMLPHEVVRIIQQDEEETEDSPKLNIAFNLGDRVKVKEGTFESFEGEVHAIDEHSGRVTVMINIFGRSTPVELEYWQAEQV